MCLAFAAVTPLPAASLVTSDPLLVAAFQAGAFIERFDDLNAFTITSYGSGQLIDATQTFSSRNGATQPTFNSGGASPSDPVGNPGTPIGIFAPSGGISGNVVSPNNVAGPLVINEKEPFNFGFMEVIFPLGASKVGFWITHGELTLQLRDIDGNTLTTGDFEVNGVANQFVGLSRNSADAFVAALVGSGDAFAIDDFTFATGNGTSVPEPAGVIGGLLAFLSAGGFLGMAGLRRRRTEPAANT
jgi:hypothetical protein